MLDLDVKFQEDAKSRANNVKVFQYDGPRMGTWEYG